MTDRASPRIEDLIEASIESYIDHVHISLPGIVQSYDAATQTATVKPAVRRPIMTEDDDIAYEEYEAITNVPVVFPGAASLSFHFALAKGDSVELVWQDFSIAGWRRTGNVSDAGDVRKHGPGYPVAFPWYRPKGGAGADTDNSIGLPNGLRIHFTSGAVKVGTGGDFVAMAAKVAQELSTLKGIFSAWTPVPNDGGAALKGAISTWASSSTDVASTNLKAD